MREGVAFTGLQVAAGTVTGVATSAGDLSAPLVVLTGGAQLAAVGRAAGVRIAVGGARHQVVVTEAHPDLAADRLPMVFDVLAGIYWRPEDGRPDVGDEQPRGAARRAPGSSTTTTSLGCGRGWPSWCRSPRSSGCARRWAATIDFTPDHLPILGAAITADGPVEGTVVAAAGGHGMMWGPAVSRAAADLALTGETDVVDVTDLGLDRFDEHGLSRLAADPIALPFPERT